MPASGYGLDHHPVAGNDYFRVPAVFFQNAENPRPHHFRVFPDRVCSGRIQAVIVHIFLIAGFGSLVICVPVAAVRQPFVQVGFHRDFCIQFSGKDRGSLEGPGVGGAED